MNLASLLGSFEPVSLEQTNEQASLLERYDTKYVIRPEQLPAVLFHWTNTHRVLEINNKRIFRYHSVYYDTPGLRLYHAHHAGAGNRVKFRIREYVDSQLSYCEIKKRDNRGFTEKQRTRIKDSDLVSSIMHQTGSEYTRHTRNEALQETLQVDYDRVTLVAKQGGERITIDLNLRFCANDRRAEFPERVIIEIKRPRGVIAAEQRYFRTIGIRSGSISKYCLGILSLYPTAKHHHFRLPLRILAKQLSHHAPATSFR